MESIISDVDTATELAFFTKEQILQETRTAIVGQANEAPSSVLDLLEQRLGPAPAWSGTASASLTKTGDDVSTPLLDGSGDSEEQELAPLLGQAS